MSIWEYIFPFSCIQSLISSQTYRCGGSSIFSTNMSEPVIVFSTFTEGIIGSSVSLTFLPSLFHDGRSSPPYSDVAPYSCTAFLALSFRRHFNALSSPFSALTLLLIFSSPVVTLLLRSLLTSPHRPWHLQPSWHSASSFWYAAALTMSPFRH